MTDDRAALAGFDGVARLFPLPNLVLFPQVVQGLHIFEYRYRDLMAAALAGDGLIALVLLRPGWEDDYDHRPPVEEFACLGRILQHERLPDGRYNLRLKGIARVRIVEELPPDETYRRARVEVIPDEPAADLSRLTVLRRRLADAVLPRFAPAGPVRAHLAELFDGDTPLGQLCDLLAYALPLPLELRQHLLGETRPAERAEALLVAFAPDDADADREFPPQFSSN